MPVLLDNEGQLGVTFGLVRTACSVLINTDEDIVYTTHESDKILDTFIDKLAQEQNLKSKSSDLLTEQQNKVLSTSGKKGSYRNIRNVILWLGKNIDLPLADTSKTIASQPDSA
jgi:hypothetical protein